ncbi:hypothetical protein ACYZFV_15725 [Serratia ureilytica]
MTVSTEVSREEYTGNGVTTDFDYRFRVFSADELVVTVADTTENIRTLVLNTDYTVTGAGSRNGGKVKLVSALAAGWRIGIERELPLTQETDVRNQGNFLPEVHEDAWDKLTMLIQQTWSFASLALRKPNWLAKYYDAKGNRISNLSNPINGTDAANKNYVDAVGAANLGKTLRFPETYVPPMTDANVRSNMLQGYNDLGYPVPIATQTETADLALKLAGSGGSQLIGHSDLISTFWRLKDYLDQGYIRVKNRDELLSAHDYVKNVLKKRTEIRLARDFQNWTAPKTDIDLSFVTIIGEGDGVVIDATGIPNVAGNYWCRFYSSDASSINSQPLSQGVRIKGIHVIGPGRSSVVTFRLSHSPEGQLGNFATQSLSCEEFGFGDVYQQNAYLIDNYNSKITRCGIHVYMPAGFANYGEGIRYFGGVLGTSSGIAVQNDNPNGAFRFYSTSIDYVGRIVVCNRGSVELYGCHNEFNNAINKLNGIPYYCGKGGESRIIIHGGEILAHTQNINQPSVFYVENDAMGIFVRDVKFMSLITTSGRIKDGTGVFDISGFGVIDGGGNTTVSMMKSPAENIFSDPTFELANVVDWFIVQDTKPITSRTDGDNIKLTITSDTARTGTTSMKAQKRLGAGSAAIFQSIVNASFNTNNAFRFYITASGGVTGMMYVTFYYLRVIYDNQYGTPIAPKYKKFGATRSIDVSTITNDWVAVVQQQSRSRVPSWATHVAVDVSMTSCSAGDYYFDDAEIYQI